MFRQGGKGRLRALPTNIGTRNDVKLVGKGRSLPLEPTRVEPFKGLCSKDSLLALAAYIRLVNK